MWWGKNGDNFPRIKKFRTEVAEGVVPTTWWDREIAGDNQEARREIRSLFLDDEVDFSTPKPTRLIQRILQIATNSNDIVLDSFAGSGTTGHAVLKQNAEDGGNRRFILVEMEHDIAQNITAERLGRVTNGYAWTDQKGNQRLEPGIGGGFRYCNLGPTLFDANGHIQSEVSYSDLAQHVYFVETGEPLPAPAASPFPLLGVSGGRAIYLLYNGVMKDFDPEGGNILGRSALNKLPPFDGPKVIYGNGCLISDPMLRQMNITFRQIPYEIRAS